MVYKISESLITHIKALPGIVFFKDLRFRYQEVSRLTLDFIGKSNPVIIGKTDYELPWENEAEKIREHDIQALNNRVYSQISWHSWRLSGAHSSLLLVTKWPLFNDDNELIGIWGNGINLPVMDFYKLTKEFEHLPTSHQRAAFPNCYLLQDNNEILLTPRQAECLHYILQGYTSKMIAQHLSISYRTVEQHTNLLQKKFHCKQKSELIKKIYEKS